MRAKIALAALAAVACACLAAPGVASADESAGAGVLWNQDAAGTLLAAKANCIAVDCAVIMVATTANGISAWFHPVNSKGQIRLDGTNLCLQQDNGATPDLILNTCGLPQGKGGASEDWIPTIIPFTQWPEFTYQNYYTKACLNDDYYTGFMDSATCNDGSDQIWQSPLTI